MDLCIPATDPPMMLALVAFGLCVGPRFPQVMLVWESSTSGAAVIPGLPTLVGCGRAHRLLRAGTVATKPGWLLWEASCTCTARATVAPVTTAIVVLLWVMSLLWVILVVLR